MPLPILSAHRETVLIAGAETPPVVAANMRHVLPEYHGKIFLPESALAALPKGGKTEKVEVLADDNRTVIAPGVNAAIRPNTYYLSVKGVGTRSPMFGFAGMDAAGPGGAWPGADVVDHWRERAYHRPVFTGEMWFGNGPYGASGLEGPRDSAAITEMAGESMNCINGFWICPVLAYNRLPDWLVSAFRRTYWYRKYPGDWYQQMRLVPSDVRLYFHSDVPLGVKPQTVLKAFGIESAEQLDCFMENFICSGVGALTLAARTLRKEDGGFMLLDYDDVWLDKDSVIAPDGKLHFADLDDLEWRSYGNEEAVREKIRRQFERNFYEFMFGLDCLLTERCRLAGAAQTVGRRRADLAARYEMALAGDARARTESSRSGLDLIVRPQEASVGETAIRLVDLEGGD